MDKKPNTPNEYLKTKVMTASPEQLQLMLYDGAIRFCEQARSAIEEKQIEQSVDKTKGRVPQVEQEYEKNKRNQTDSVRGPIDQGGNAQLIERCEVTERVVGNHKHEQKKAFNDLHLA